MTTTMRDVFADTVTALLDERTDIAVILADIGVSRFADTGAVSRHPGRVVNVGIREQLMIGVAAGFALEGFRPIAHSYTPFLIQRPFEQIKLDFAHQGVHGILVSIGASYDATSEGRTHQAPGDVALMSTLPEWSIHVPGHAAETERLLRDAASWNNRSAYIRLSDQHNSEPHLAADGGLAMIRTGGSESPLVITVGPMLDRTLAATEGLDVTVLYASTVRPFDSDGVVGAIGGGDVVLVEPYLEGTSASEVSRALVNVPHRLLAIGVPASEHRHYGEIDQHDAAYGLDIPGLRHRIDNFLATA
jgi:transketolase